MEKCNLSLTKLDDIQNHEDFLVVWLSLDDVPNSIMNFAEYLKKYDSYQACSSYIKTFTSERKILLVLTMDLEYLSIFEDLSQIQSIYILKKQDEYVKFNKQDHPNLHGNGLTLLWNQYFIYYLVKHPNANMEELKKIMLDQCRFEYKNNPRELMKINDFDMHCSNENILNWYTKDSFLYRLLNKAFRTRNIDFICQFQYFLIGLYQKFQELSETQKEVYPLTVYRGQIINANDLKRLQSNVERFISINTIMSTSRLENIARSFICDAPLSVLFKININDTTNSKFRPFIDISKFSSMPAEQEILFFVGTIFSIVSVQEENHSTWIIELTLNNQISEPIEDFICDFQKHIHDFKNKHYLFMKTDDFSMIQQYYYILTRKDFCLNNLPINMIYIYVAFIFSNLGCYEKAIELYKKYLLIGNISIDSPQSKVIHIIIGYLYYHFSDYNNAFVHYGIALSLLDDTNLLAIKLYNHIGDVWNNMDNVDNAISCYQLALYIANQKNISGSDIDQKINDLRLKTKNSLENSPYERQINNIDEHYRSIINPDNETHLKHYQSQLNDGHNLTLIQRIDALYQIGICLMRKGDFLQALEIFLKTKQIIIEEQLDDANNPTSIRCVDLSYQIGLSLMKKGDFSQALKSLLQAEQIIIKNPPLWERFPQLLSTLYDNIAILYFFLNDPLKGIITWKKSIDIRINFSYN